MTYVPATERVIRHDTRIVASFVHDVIFGEPGDFDPCEALGFLDKRGLLIAGVVYHDYQPDHETIEISAGSTTPKWLTKNRLREILYYPFYQLDCQMVIARTDERNNRVNNILRGIGAEAYPVRRLRGRFRDGIMFTLTKEDWVNSRFMRSDHGNETAEAA